MPVAELLEKAAGTDLDALREWDRWERGLAALLPGQGRWIVLNAKRAGLDPFAADRLDFHVGGRPLAALFFRANPKHRSAFATSVGARFI